MDFLELAAKRYSCRNFSEKEVEKEKIDKLLEVFRLAPTACNYQPQRIKIITDSESKKKLRFCTPCGWGAPVQMIICFDKDVSAKRRDDNLDLGYMDASIATTSIMFEATDIGLASTWVEMVKPDKVRQYFNIPDNYEVFGLLFVGYPKENDKPMNLHSERNNINNFLIK